MMRTLELVGVGARFRDRRFQDYPQGEELKALLLERWSGVVREGQGITIVGGSALAGNLHLVMARAAHLAELPIRVLGLMELVQEIQREPDEFESYRLDDVRGLFVRRWSEPKRCPLRDYEVTLVEEFVDQHLDRGGSLFPWTVGMADPPWWSEYLVQRIGERNGAAFRVAQ